MLMQRNEKCKEELSKEEEIKNNNLCFLFPLYISLCGKKDKSWLSCSGVYQREAVSIDSRRKEGFITEVVYNQQYK